MGSRRRGEQLGIPAGVAGDYPEAAHLHREGLGVVENLLLWTDVSYRLSRLSWIARLTGHYGSAAEFHERDRRRRVLPDLGLKLGLEVAALLPPASRATVLIHYVVVQVLRTA